MSVELHLKLAETLNKISGVKASLTFEFLDAIDAADNLVGFKQILQNLLSILPLLEAIDSEQWDKEKVIRLLAICNVLLDQEKNIGFLINENNTKKEDLFNKNTANTPNALYGPVVSNPLYSSLWSTRILNKSSFLHLQAQFIQAFHQYKKLESDKKEYDSARKTFSFLIREMHNDNNKTELISLIPERPVETDKLYDGLSYLRFHDGDIKKQHNDLTRVLAYALGNRLVNTRNTNNKSISISFPVITKQYEDPDTELELESYQVIKTSVTKPSEKITSFNLGNSLEEVYSGPTFFKTDKRIKNEEGETVEDRVGKHKEISRGIATNNQHLPYQWGRLNFVDFISLISGIEELALQGENESTELAAFISIMFWTSSSLERAANIRVIKQIPNSKGNELYFCDEDCGWCIQSPVLKQRNMGRDWRLFLEPIGHSIALPCIPNIASLIKKTIRSKRILPGKKSQLLFTEDLKDQVQNFIVKQNKKNNSRLTQSRISSYLYHLLADQTGDVGDAALITGNLPTAGQSTSLYYYAPQTEVLKEKYTELCNKLIRSVNTKLASSLEEIDIEDKTNLSKNKRVGSRICPLTNTVQLMVKDLKEMLQCRKRNRKHSRFLIELHNAYTAYTVMLFGFSTGYRAVNDPFQSVMDIDWDSQFVAISDKDNDDNYNTRIVWLPDITIEQLKFYEEHRDQLIEEMTFLNPALAEKLKRRITINWKSEFNKGHELPFFFFLNASYKEIKVGPISLKQNVKWSFELPQNTNRHFLRTRLREQGVDGEIVDIFMGHWENGQEPHNPFSTLSPQDYKSVIAEPLTKILNDVGWEQIRGLG